MLQSWGLWCRVVSCRVVGARHGAFSSKRPLRKRMRAARVGPGVDPLLW